MSLSGFRPLFSAAVVVALAGAALGCASGGGGGAPSAQALPIARLSAESNQILGGGPGAFKAQLSALRGHPVVVNQWASWCGPCRFEFPFFQRLARRYRGRVAFLGVNSQDNVGSARKFLTQFPVPYPSFEDGDTQIARVFRGGRAWPTTAFYDAKGQLIDVHVGGYATAAKLEDDVVKALAPPA